MNRLSVVTGGLLWMPTWIGQLRPGHLPSPPQQTKTEKNVMLTRVSLHVRRTDKLLPGTSSHQTSMRYLYKGKVCFTPQKHIDFHIIVYWTSNIWSLWHIYLEKTLLSPHRLLFLISSNRSFICTFPKTGQHIPQPLIDKLWAIGWNRKCIRCAGSFKWSNPSQVRASLPELCPPPLGYFYKYQYWNFLLLKASSIYTNSIIYSI